MQSFFIRQFGDDIPKLCNEEAVSFDSESLQVLQNTQVCSTRKVENDAVGEEEAMQRVRQAVMEYAASRMIFVTSPNPTQAPQPSHSPFSTKAVTARKVRLLLGCPLISLPRRVNLFSAHVVLVFNRRNGKTIKKNWPRAPAFFLLGTPLLIGGRD